MVVAIVAIVGGGRDDDDNDDDDHGRCGRNPSKGDHSSLTAVDTAAASSSDAGPS